MVLTVRYNKRRLSTRFDDEDGQGRDESCGGGVSGSGGTGTRRNRRRSSSWSVSTSRSALSNQSNLTLCAASPSQVGKRRLAEPTLSLGIIADKKSFGDDRRRSGSVSSDKGLFVSPRCRKRLPGDKLSRLKKRAILANSSSSSSSNPGDSSRKDSSFSAYHVDSNGKQDLHLLAAAQAPPGMELIGFLEPFPIFTSGNVAKKKQPQRDDDYKSAAVAGMILQSLHVIVNDETTQKLEQQKRIEKSLCKAMRGTFAASSSIDPVADLACSDPFSLITQPVVTQLLLNAVQALLFGGEKRLDGDEWFVGNPEEEQVDQDVIDAINDASLNIALSRPQVLDQDQDDEEMLENQMIPEPEIPEKQLIKMLLKGSNSGLQSLICRGISACLATDWASLDVGARSFTAVAEFAPLKLLLDLAVHLLQRIAEAEDLAEGNSILATDALAMYMALFSRLRRHKSTAGCCARSGDFWPLGSCLAQLVKMWPAQTIHVVINRMLRSWPSVGSSTCMLYMYLIDTFLHLCPAALLGALPHTKSLLFQRINAQLASTNSHHVDRACKILGAPHVVLHHIAPFDYIHRTTKQALFTASRSHWSSAARTQCEDVFDSLLDFC